MSDNSSALSYRERVVRYYQAYAPEGLSKVDSAMERYAGQEERLLNDLKTKYGKAEPTDEQVRIGLASPPAPMPSTELSSSPSIRRTGSTAGPPRRPSMAGSPRSRQGSVGSPNQGNSSFAASPSGVVAASSPPPPASFFQQSGTFGDVQVSDGDDDDPFGTPLAESQRRPVDPYTSMRSKVTHDVGFSDVIFKRIWEDAWMGKIPYGNLYKTWGDSIIHSGFGWKLTNASAIQRWQKRYFVLVPHFLYYFDSDDAKAPCKGAVYLERATIKEQDIKERKGIVITPRVHKKPLELVSEGDFSNFTINFDPKKAQDVWVELLNNMAKIVPTPTQPAGTSSLDGATPTRGGIPDSPGVALKKVQSSVGSASLARRAASTVSPMRLERSSTAGVSGGGGYGAVGGDQQSSLFSPVGAVGAPHMTLAQFPPPSNSFDRNTSYPLTPREAAILAAADAHGAQLPPMPIVRPNAFLAALEDPSVLNNSVPPLAQESNAANSNAVGVNMATIAATGASSSAAAATTTVSEHHNRQLLQQQQKLQQMLVAAQQQQSDLLFRSQLQQEVTKARQTLHVDESDLKRRIGRIADDRDTPALAEALLSFVIDNVSDLNALWKLMSQLDDLPRKKTNTPASSPVPPQQQEFGGDGYYAAQQQQQQPNLVGLTPRASPPPQQYGSSSVGGGVSISQYPPTPHVAYQQQQPVLHRHHTPNLDDDIVSVSRVPAAQPTTTLTYDHISHQIAADQAHYRETEAALHRQRILENQEIAARYQQQQQQQMDHAFSNSGGHHHHAVPGGPSSLFATTAAAGLPTASPGGHLYSPSASSWPIAHRAGSLGAAYPPSAGNMSVGQRQGAEDYAWQERLARMKQRKRAVEGLLNDLPA